MTKKKERFRYPMFTCRISQEVMEQLKQAKEQSELSWNKFIKDLLNGNKQKD